MRVYIYLAGLGVCLLLAGRLTYCGAMEQEYSYTGRNCSRRKIRWFDFDLNSLVQEVGLLIPFGSTNSNIK